MWEDVISIYNHLNGRFAFFRAPQARWILPVCGLCVCVCVRLKIRLWLFMYPCSLQRTLFNVLNATPSTLAQVHNGNVLPLKKLYQWFIWWWAQHSVHDLVGCMCVYECWNCRRNLVVPSIQFIFSFWYCSLFSGRRSKEQPVSIGLAEVNNIQVQSNNLICLFRCWACWKRIIGKSKEEPECDWQFVLLVVRLVWIGEEPLLCSLFKPGCCCDFQIFATGIKSIFQYLRLMCRSFDGWNAFLKRHTVWNNPFFFETEANAIQ